jgi:bifunctional DNA-binding transcriptional regulator/antitoxin component of YhaV-PrlF toxin-antitoxin module
MPQLEKGGKWVFGWVVVQPGKKITVPSEAYREYGFQAGEEIVFTRGSRRSGGFGIGRAAKFPTLLRQRTLALGRMGKKGQVVLPLEVELQVGDRLLAVRGSGYALGFLAQGSICEKALRHPELTVL